MGYVFQFAALAVLAVAASLFEAGPADPENGFERHMLSLAALAAVSTALSLVGLRRIRARPAAYYWFSSLVLLAGLTLLAGLAIDVVANTADIGGIILMWLGAWGLGSMEALGLVWTLGIDVVRLARRPAAR